MATVQHEVDHEWADRLLNADASAWERLMIARYVDLAAMSEDDRQRRLRSMTFAEYAFADEDLRGSTLSRLRAWLTIDQDTAKKIAVSLDAVMAEMPGAVAWRRVALVQTMSREFTSRETLRLRELVPGIFGQDSQLARPD